MKKINYMNVKQLSLKFLCLFSLCFFVTFKGEAQKVAASQQKAILILDATAHIGNGEIIPRAAVGFREGKIDMVLSAIDVRMDSSKYDTVIHLPGKHLYPGLIAPNTRLGLVEIEAVRSTRDFDDVGDYNPHVRTLTAYNTDSRITPTVRTNGILIAEVAPKGGIISGSSSIFALDGWNWEDALVQSDVGIHLNWPNIPTRGLEKESEFKKAIEKYENHLKELNDFFKQAHAYQKVNFHLEKNLRFEAMKTIFEKKSKVFVHANLVQEITDAIYFFDGFDVEIVLVGAYDSWLVADLLKDRNIPIILRRVHSLPMREDDPIDLPYKLPKILLDKGLLVALENSGRMEAMGTRNLPFYAGTAAAYGVSKEAALSMITLNTAIILGVDHRLGSIELGKDATLFISDGDALDMRTNQVILAFINGNRLDLTNPQIELYQKFTKKYKGESDGN
tara:strand:- start:26064 stop:27410 length:1347 start_codon:yes stop_codon:yes gene_type:complete